MWWVMLFWGKLHSNYDTKKHGYCRHIVSDFILMNLISYQISCTKIDYFSTEYKTLKTCSYSKRGIFRCGNSSF